MAVTLSADLTEIDDCDSSTNWSSNETIGVDVGNYREGAGSVGIEKVSQETSYAQYDYYSDHSNTYLDITGETHIYFWAQSTIELDTKANGGIRLRLTDASGNYKEWWVGGSDNYYGSFQSYVCYTGTTPDASSGTLNLSQIRYITIYFKVLGKTVVGAYNCWVDILYYGTGIVVKGGTFSTPGTFDDIITADETPAYGVLNKKYGAFIAQGPITFGDSSGTTDTYFQDESQILLFADAMVSSSHYEIKIVGNSTGTNSFKLGTKSGSAGISGCVIKSVGSSKVKFTATDTNVDVMGLYGCTFLDAGTVSLPVTGGTTREVLNCTFEASGEVLASTCTVTNCNFINSDNQGVQMSSTSHNISDCNFISCSDGVEITAAGTYTFNNLQFSGCTYDIENSGNSATVNVNATNGANPSTHEETGTPAGTTTINNAVTLTLIVKGEDTGAISGATVGIFKSEHTDLKRAIADDGGTQTDETTAATDDTTNDMTLLPSTPAVNDAYYFGSQDMFWKLELVIGTSGSGTWNITWEYYDSSSGWTSISSRGNINDETDAFRAAAGTHYVTFDIPDDSPADWAITTVKGINAYWIRAKVSSYTSITTQPKGTRAYTWNVLMNKVTNSSGIATESYNYPGSNVPIIIRVRKSSIGSTRYFPINTTGTISGDFNTEIVMIEDAIAPTS